MKQAFSCDRCLHDQVQCKFNPAKQEKCRGCAALNIDCVWTQMLKPRPPDDSYIQYLEERAKALERQLKQVLPAVKLKRDIDDLLKQATSSDEKEIPMESVQSVYSHLGSTVTTMKPVLDTPATLRLIQHVRLTDVGTRLANMDTDDENAIWDATVSTRLDEPRYHGRSSLEVLSRDARVFRSDPHSNGLGTLPTNSTSHRRPEFWRPTAAEIRLFSQDRDPWGAEPYLGLELPPDDLMPILLGAYFDNVTFPVIHRPLFEKQLTEGLHEREDGFLRVVLLVCALGSRWCNDPRDLDERWPVSLSSGHQWFRQFELCQKNWIRTDQLSLWDAQMLVLMSVYFCGSSASYALWVVIGVGIRMMQDIGSHRERPHKTLESELHKRCFWSMLLLDRFHSINLARPGAMQDMDSDLSDVLEVDDEMWSLEPDATPPIQPEGVPSKLSIFNQLISICRISGRCLQTVYALGRTKRRISLDGPQGALWMFNDINARLKRWAQDLPPFLRLPHPGDKDNSPLFPDIALMWSSYYALVISANRPFVTETPSLAVPSMKICCEAAHAFATMIDACHNTSYSGLIPAMYHTAFSSAMILLVDLIGQRRAQGVYARDTGFDTAISSTSYTRQQKQEDVRKCVQVLRLAERHFPVVVTLCDMVQEFGEFWQLQLPPSCSHFTPPSASLPSEPHVSSFHNNDSQEHVATFNNNEPLGSTLVTAGEPEPLPHLQNQDFPGIPFKSASEYNFLPYSPHPNDVLPNIHLANISHLTSEQQSAELMDLNLIQAWNGSHIESSSTSTISNQTHSHTLQQLEGPNHNVLDILQSWSSGHLEYNPSLPRPELLYTGDPTEDMADWNVVPAPTPNGDNLIWDSTMSQWNAMLHSLEFN